MYKAGGLLPLYMKKVKDKPLSIKSVAFLSAKKSFHATGKMILYSRTE